MLIFFGRSKPLPYRFVLLFRVFVGVGTLTTRFQNLPIIPTHRVFIYVFYPCIIIIFVSYDMVVISSLENIVPYLFVAKFLKSGYNLWQFLVRCFLYILRDVEGAIPYRFVLLFRVFVGGGTLTPRVFRFILRDVEAPSPTDLFSFSAYS